MPNFENMDVMLGKFSKNDFTNEHENDHGEVHPVSAGIQGNSNTLGEDFRSLLNK